MTGVLVTNEQLRLHVVVLSIVQRLHAVSLLCASLNKFFVKRVMLFS